MIFKKVCHMHMLIVCLAMIVVSSNAQTDIPTLPAPPEGVEFVWWQEPNEAAFAMQIPVGWRIQGGMLDIFGTKRISITAVSPDGRNMITIGTNTLELIIVPTPELDALGYFDGHVFIQDEGIVVAVSPFRSGAKSAQIMADTYIKPNCESYQITNTYDYERQDIDGVIYSPGEAQFKCNINNVTYSGYFYAVTIAHPIDGLGHVWTLDTFYGILALPNNIVIAAQVLQYMVQTTIYNPAWIDAQRASADQALTTIYDAFQVELADSALLDATLSQIIGMSQQSLMQNITSMDETNEYNYEFLP